MPETNIKETIKTLRADEPQEGFPWWKPEEDIKQEEIKLHISLPTYDNSVNLLQDSGLRAALMGSTLAKRLKVEFNFCGSDSLICRARDKLAASFLASDSEWQLQLDNDIIFPYGMGQELASFYSNWMNEDTFNLFMNEGVFKHALQLNAIDEILRSGIADNKKIVGGFYFWRGGERNFNQAGSIVEQELTNGGHTLEFKLRKDNYLVSDKISTGFLLIHRSVYEAVAKKFPELAYEVPGVIPDKLTHAFYLPNITEEKADGKKFNFYRSEDYAFAWRAKQAGFEPCLNLNILLGHIGTTIYSWFDRPILQKALFNLYDNPKHEIERITYVKDPSSNK
jgi:hypothetical protein